MGTAWLSTAPTGWSRAPWSAYAKPESWTTRRAPTPPAAETLHAAAAESRGASAAARRSEHLTNLHPEAGGHIADDGRRGAHRCRGVPAAARLGAAPGRLP